MTTENDGAKNCAIINLKHSKDTVEFSEKLGILTDFILPEKFNEYIFSKIPEYDFRVDSFFHTLKNRELTPDEGLVVSLIG